MKDAITITAVVLCVIIICVLLWAIYGWVILTLASLLGLSIKISWLRCILAGFCLSLVGLGIKVNLRKNND